MKTFKSFFKVIFTLLIITTPLACGSDDNGENPVVDIEAVYSVNPAKEVSNYAIGESLAAVSDADGTITEATLGSGSDLPAGVALNSGSGELTVSDVAALMAGTYSMAITTEDNIGGTTDHTIGC